MPGITSRQLEEALRRALPGLEIVEAERQVVTRETMLHVEAGISARMSLTDEALHHEEALPALLGQLVRRIRDDALQAFGLQERIDEIREKAERETANARIILLAELRAALAFQIRDPEAQRIVVAAFDKAAERG